MRTENVTFHFNLSNPQARKYRKDIKQFYGGPPIEDGDVLRCRYSLEINYFGRVTRNLKFVLELAKEGLIKSIDYRTLDGAESLVLEIGKLIGELKQAKASDVNSPETSQ